MLICWGSSLVGELREETKLIFLTPNIDRSATICGSTFLHCRIVLAEHLCWFIIWKLNEKKDKLFVKGFKRMEFRMAGSGPKTGPGPESNVKYRVHFLNIIRIIMSPDGSVLIHHCYSDYIRIWNIFRCFVLILVWLRCPGCLECLLSLPHLCLSQWSPIYHIMNNNTSYAVFSFSRIPSLSRRREATHTTKHHFEGEELQESNVGSLVQPCRLVAS